MPAIRDRFQLLKDPRSGGGNGATPRLASPSASETDVYQRNPMQTDPYQDPTPTPPIHPSEKKKGGYITSLAHHAGRLFSEAVRHRDSSGITEELLASKRQIEGEYDRYTKAKIAEVTEMDTYFNLTRTKVVAAKALWTDALMPSGEYPFELGPTPEPELPYSKLGEVVERVSQEAMEIEMVQPGTVSPELVRARTMELYDEVLREEMRESQKRAVRVQRKIEDQFAEGNWGEAFDKFLHYLCRYPTAVLKGPYLKRERVGSWVDGEYRVVDKDVLWFDAPSPFDIYPGPFARSCQESYFCEVMELDPADLSQFRGVEGWSTEAIDAVLRAKSFGELETLREGEQERSDLDHRESPIHVGSWPDGKLKAVNIWAWIPGEMLTEWGYDKVALEPTEFYAANTILVGNWVVYAVLNPDQLDRRPYYEASVFPEPDSFWGTSYPKAMRDCQQGYNATLRSILVNGAFASGPMGWYDRSMLVGGEDPTVIQPWNMIAFDSSQGGAYGGGREPMKFFQPDMNVQQLLQVKEMFAQEADDRTLIPRYTHGNENVGGAGQTASGLSMLMGASAKAAKEILAHLTLRVIKPCVEQVYRWDLQHLDDPSLKGDVRVVARGPLDLQIRETALMRQQEFLDRTNNPTDQRILGYRGRAKVLAQVGERTGVPLEELMPSDEELEAMDAQVRAQEQAMAMMAAGDGGPPGQQQQQPEPPEGQG